jgi:hypothetical protein
MQSRTMPTVRIDYHDLADSQFEELVVAVCTRILGPGVSPFSTGKDGGRDGRFAGTAIAFPSASAPHVGKFVLQAKHTEDPVAKYSDTDFTGPSANAILTKELPRIKALRASGELENYYLFSNRRLAGGADAAIRARIIGEAGVPIVELFGIERLDLLLKQWPDALHLAGLGAFSRPLIVTPDDLAEVIVKLAEKQQFFAEAASVDDLIRTSFAAKNSVNGLSSDFARHITRSYLPHFDGVKKFLALPGNDAVAARYEDAATEFQEQLLAHRASYDTFDKVLVRLLNLLLSRDGDLARNKRLTRLVVYYMYFNCDIGNT